VRVFVSSTVSDLLDIRAELAELLTDLGAEPVMSDNSLTDFTVLPDRNFNHWSRELVHLSVDVVCQQRFASLAIAQEYSRRCIAQLPVRQTMTTGREPFSAHSLLSGSQARCPQIPPRT
jgi:hypothetical protein